MKQTYLDLPEDLEWLRQVHCPDLPRNIIAAIITGNEDAPSKVEAWNIGNDNADASADYVRMFVYD